MRFGIIGLGKISPRHIQAIKDIEGDIVATCDVDRNKKLPEYRFYISTEEMFRREKLDFASICTPNGWHSYHATEALSNGVNVICEKPITLSSSEAVKLGQLAEEKGLRIFPVMQNRYNKIIQYLKEIIWENKLGEIYNINLEQTWCRPQEYFQDWRGTKWLDGGTLINQGIHFVDFLLYLLGDGEPKNIKAIKRTLARKIEVEDSLSCIFEINDTVGSINFSVLAYRQNLGSVLTIIAQYGTIVLGGTACEKVNVWNCNLLAPEDVGITTNDYGNYRGSLPLHSKVYENVLSVWKGEAEQDVTLHDAVRVLKFIEDIYKAGE